MSGTEGSRRKQRTPGQAKGPKGRPRTTPETEKGETLRRAAINVFIVFHLIAITCVALPVDFSPLRKVGELVGPYMLWTGLFQRWDMFAPDPTAVNSYVKAVVISAGSPHARLVLSQDGRTWLCRTISKREIPEIPGGPAAGAKCSSLARCCKTCCEAVQQPNRSHRQGPPD